MLFSFASPPVPGPTVNWLVTVKPHQSGFTVTGGFNVGPGTGGQAQAHSTVFQLNDDVSWVHGNHQINFGGGVSVYKMLFYGNVYSQTNWTFPNLAQFLLGQFSTNSLSLAERSAAVEEVRECVCAGHLEGDSAIDPERGSALGTVSPSRGGQWLGLQLQPGESDRRKKDHAIQQRASGPYLPGGCRFSGQIRYEQHMAPVCAARGARLRSHRYRQNDYPRFLGNRL